MKRYVLFIIMIFSIITAFGCGSKNKVSESYGTYIYENETGTKEQIVITKDAVTFQDVDTSWIEENLVKIMYWNKGHEEYEDFSELSKSELESYKQKWKDIITGTMDNLNGNSYSYSAEYYEDTQLVEFSIPYGDYTLNLFYDLKQQSVSLYEKEFVYQNQSNG